jgi:hypothetical protein
VLKSDISGCKKEVIRNERLLRAIALKGALKVENDKVDAVEETAIHLRAAFQGWPSSAGPTSTLGTPLSQRHQLLDITKHKSVGSGGI